MMKKYDNNDNNEISWQQWNFEKIQLTKETCVFESLMKQLKEIVFEIAIVHAKFRIGTKEFIFTTIPIGEH